MRLRFAHGILLLAPLVAVAFSGCDTTRPQTGAAPENSDSPEGRVPEPRGEGVRSVGIDRFANAPANTTESAALENAVSPSGLAKIHGRFYVIRNNKATMIDQRQRFTEGVYFERGGRITLQDGNIVRLREGEMVTFSGERLDVPPNIQLPKPLPEEGPRR